jgi:hypothetical protein
MLPFSLLKFTNLLTGNDTLELIATQLSEDVKELIAKARIVSFAS